MPFYNTADLDEVRREIIPLFEVDEIQPLEPYLKRSSELTVVDAGANSGAWTRAWLNRNGDKTGQVHLFEPQPGGRIHHDGRDLFTPEEQARMQVHVLGLGDAAGLHTIHVDESGSLLGTLHAQDHTGWGPDLTDTEQVRLTTLDYFAAPRGIEHIDVLKLDIEGHEFAAMKGASNYLMEGRIDVIAFEVGGPWAFSRTFFIDVYRLLHGFGYSFALMKRDRTGGIIEFDKYEYRWELINKTSVFLAYRK